MKRLFLFLFAAIMASQMWAQLTLKIDGAASDNSNVSSVSCYYYSTSNSVSSSTSSITLSYNTTLKYYKYTSNPTASKVYYITVTPKNGYEVTGWASSSTTFSEVTSKAAVASASSNSWYKDGNTVYFKIKTSASTIITATVTAKTSGGDQPTGTRSSIAATTKSAQSATVNFSGSNAGTTINYALPSDVVDMGTAGYWRTANVGTTYETSAGYYYQWGTSKKTGSVYSTASNYTCPTTADLVSTNDAATVALGTGYCTPTKDEWQSLISNCTWSYSSNAYTVTNSTTGGQIVIPANTGKYENSSKGNSGAGCYWSSTYNSGDPYTFQCTSTKTTFYAVSSTSNAIGKGYMYYSMFVRPIYNMTGTLYTLTVNVVTPSKTYVYKYKGASGQVVNVTASAQSGYSAKWGDNNNDATSARQFTLTSDMTKTINYTSSVTYVTATFKNYDNSTLYTNSQVQSGTTPTYGGATPTKPQDNTYTYSFTGWSPALAAITSNTTYTAQFNSAFRNYSVTFRTSAGDLNPNVKNDYHYNDVITNKPATDPQKIVEEEADYYYEFDNWYIVGTETPYEEGMTVTENMIFEPSFTKYSYDKDTVTVNVAGGQGTVVLNYAGKTYTMNTAEDGNTKAFIIYNATGALSAVANAARGYHVVINDTYKASQRLRSLQTTTLNFKFEANTPVDLIENHAGTAYNDSLVEAHENEYLTVTVKTDASTKRSITNGNWATICLPFDYDVTTEDIFFDQVYALSNAYIDDNNIATLNFVRQTKMKAYVPYLITARTEMAELVFDGVTLKEYTDQTLQVTEGNVDFIASIDPIKVTNDPENLTKFYVSGKTLKFANAKKGTTMYGYRAYFEKNGNTVGGAPVRRAAIELDGETIQQVIITEDGDILPANQTRKYIQDGVMIIERNGVRYTADGLMID